MQMYKVRVGIKGAISLHKEFGVSYFQLLRSLLSKNKKITVKFKGMPLTMGIYDGLIIGDSLWNAKKAGWEIVDVVNDLVVYENRQKGIKLYSSIDDHLFYIHIIDEIFVQEIYKADFKNKVVIDVGAYRGESAIYFALQGAKKVIALEPDEDSYKLALMNIKENLREKEIENKILLLKKALAPNKGVINFYKFSHSPVSNSINPNNIDSNEKIATQVEAITLDEVIEIAGKEEIGLLKMDCEGCEYSVLNSFSNYDMIDNIILEYHHGLQNLPGLLKSQGFEVKVIKGDKNVGILKAYRG